MTINCIARAGRALGKGEVVSSILTGSTRPRNFTMKPIPISEALLACVAQSIRSVAMLMRSPEQAGW
jgi:hypothetical protein